MNVVATLAARVLLNLTGAAAGTLQPAAYADTTWSQALSAGTATLMADQGIQLSGTLAASGLGTIDLAGAITDAFGASVAIGHIKGIVLVNTSAAGLGANLRIKNTSTLVDGAGSSQHFNLGPGGIFMLADPNLAGLCAVTAGSADLIILENNGSSATTYTITVIGIST